MLRGRTVVVLRCSCWITSYSFYGISNGFCVFFFLGRLTRLNLWPKHLVLEIVTLHCKIESHAENDEYVSLDTCIKQHITKASDPMPIYRCHHHGRICSTELLQAFCVVLVLFVCLFICSIASSLLCYTHLLVRLLVFLFDGISSLLCCTYLFVCSLVYLFIASSLLCCTRFSLPIVDASFRIMKNVDVHAI